MTSFQSSAAFAAFLTAKANTLSTSKTMALSKGARIVQADAKSRIGHYQTDVGPFPAWDPLTAGTIQDKQRKGFGVPDPLLRTGQMRDSIVAKVDEDGFAVGSNDPIAGYQERGTGDIPPRPFLGPALYENREEVVKVVTEDLVAWLKDKNR